jgi:hypothetical protein
MKAKAAVDTPKRQIVGGLDALAVPIEELSHDPANARTHSPRNIEAIKTSLRQFGQRKPIIVQADGMLVRAGNGTLEAAKQLGWTSIAALVVDEDNVTATAFALADNRTAELAEWDFEALSMNVRGLIDDGVSVEDLGWEQFEIEPLLEANWLPPEQGDLPGGPASGMTIIRIRVPKEEESRTRKAIDQALSGIKGLVVE